MHNALDFTMGYIQQDLTHFGNTFLQGQCSRQNKKLKFLIICLLCSFLVNPIYLIRQTNDNIFVVPQTLKALQVFIVSFGGAVYRIFGAGHHLRKDMN